MIKLSNKHAKTLLAVFEQPTSRSIKFADLESLFLALGGYLVEGRGSRVAVKLDGSTLTVHRPHPEKEAMPYQVEQIRRFLTGLGITP